MKKIDLRRHVDLDDNTTIYAGQQVVTNEVYDRLKSKNANMKVLENLTSKGESKGEPQPNAAPDAASQEKK